MTTNQELRDIMETHGLSSQEVADLLSTEDHPFSLQTVNGWLLVSNPRPCPPTIIKLLRCLLK